MITTACFVTGLVERRPAPRRGFRGECCPPTALHRLCRWRNGKLSACRRCWQFVNGIDPHQTSRIQLLESVQNKGARYVMQDWDRHTSVSQMKLSLGWCTLQERRLVNRLSFFHKSVDKYHRLELPPYVMKPQISISKEHHSHSFRNIRAQSDQYLHSFLPRTIWTWNLLPQDIVTAPSPDSLKVGFYFRRRQALWHAFIRLSNA